MKNIKYLYNAMAENLFFQITGTLILIFPIIATTGQFVYSGFYQKTVPVLLFYWPGSESNYSIPVRVWLISAIFFISYIADIIWLLRDHNLGKVILFTIPES